MPDHLERAREHRAGLRSAIGRLEHTLAAPASTRTDAWSKELAQELDDLGGALRRHIDGSEAEDGILADIVARAPRLASRVDRLREDHAVLEGLLVSARNALPTDVDSVPATRDAALALLGALIRHRHLGADLVYDAYNVDIEGGD